VASPTVAARQPSRVPIVLACPANAAQGCDGSIELTLPASRPGRGKVVAARRSHRILGRSRRFRIAAGRTSAVPVVLSRRGVRIFRRARKRRRALKVTASVAYRSEAGLRRSSRTVTVRAARRRPNTRGNRIARR
jgi:hypothetical protein